MEVGKGAAEKKPGGSWEHLGGGEGTVGHSGRQVASQSGQGRETKAVWTGRLTAVEMGEGTLAGPREALEGISGQVLTPQPISPGQIASHWPNPPGSRQGKDTYCVLEETAQADQRDRPGAVCPGGMKDKLQGGCG